MNPNSRLLHNICFVYVMAILLAGCQRPQVIGVHCPKKSSLALSYQPHFKVDYYDGFKVITIWGRDTADVTERYVLLPAGKPAPIGFENATLIEKPVRGSVALATTHTALYSKLGIVDSLFAVGNAAMIFDTAVLTAIHTGRIRNVGSGEYNTELIARLRPSFVLHSGNFEGGDKMQAKLNSMGVKTVFCPEYIEQNPLARAEWIKFLAAFYDLEEKADSLFKITEKNYLKLKQLAVAVKRKPSVFCNMPYKEVWYMPTGNNYTAQLIADAGGDFLWKNEKPNNGLNLTLDFEAVYARAAHADVWLVNALVNSLREIALADPRNKNFDAFRRQNVYNYTRRTTTNGGIDYWESGVVNPDIALADLIKIFHPQLLPNHQLYYYKKLQ
ncbi:MAG: ABC transporter substrate-binding protein [Chitinophagales bacterium]|nr:ABC transporter substrate-binding protein [Chitinophagales bacterium]